MNSRRNFLTKLGVVAASFTILPAAVTYKRVWIQSKTSPFVFPCYQIDPPNTTLGYPEWDMWTKLLGTIKWEPNMGSTLRGVRA